MHLLDKDATRTFHSIDGMPARDHIPLESDSLSSLPDAPLVHAARRGDKRAFVEIVARHQAMVCGIALGILGDFAASEDAGQEAFLTAWRKIHELREPGRLRAWLAQIARNAALGQLRRQRGENVLDEELAIVDPGPRPDEAAATQEEAALVRNSLAQLPETYRMPLILFYREGQSVSAAASALGISEDALKQRLARGREMLRERIADKVETTLGRTAPSAIFTMTVAAAIGALATPLAVASTAFAATAASATSAAASPSASFTTAMTSSKAFLVTSMVVATLCVPVGYRLGTDSAASVPRAVGLARATLPAPVPERPARAESALVAEWRALHDRYGTNGPAMPHLDEAIAKLDDRFRRQAFRAALISEWVQIDPSGGLPFFLRKGKDEVQRRQFFEEWLARSPQAAVDALLRGGERWEVMARESLQAIARAAPARLVEVATLLPSPENYWDREVQSAFSILGERDLVSARQAAEAVTGANRQQALAGVAQVWARTDFNAVTAWADGLSGTADRAELVRAALIGQAAVDPLGALDGINQVPPGGRYAHFATTTGARVLAEAAKTDFEVTIGWVSAHLGLLGREDLEGLAHAVSDRLNVDAASFLDARVADGSLKAIMPALASALLNNASGERASVWEWLKSQPQSDATKELRNRVLSSAAFQDPPLALQLVSDIPQTAEGDQQLREVARCLFNGGSVLGRFDSLYEQAPDRLRQPLVESAFSCLSGRTFDDPQKWIGRLALLPESARTTAAESLARAWAAESPEEARTWTASLPPGDAQDSVVAAFTAGWAGQDAPSASEWLASLPQGVQRDRSAQAFAVAVAPTFPMEAWAWATSMADEVVRFQATSDAISHMASRDLISARQWIEAAPFTSENKARLQAAVVRASAEQRP